MHLLANKERLRELSPDFLANSEKIPTNGADMKEVLGSPDTRDWTNVTLPEHDKFADAKMFYPNLGPTNIVLSSHMLGRRGWNTDTEN